MPTSRLEKWEEEARKRRQATNGHRAGRLEVNGGHHPEREIPAQYQGVIMEMPADIRKMFEYGWS